MRILLFGQAAFGEAVFRALGEKARRRGDRRVSSTTTGQVARRWVSCGMKTAKEELSELLDQMLDDTPMDTLLAEMHFKASVLRGLEDARLGNVMSHKEVKRRLTKWLESSGAISPTET